MRTVRSIVVIVLGSVAVTLTVLAVSLVSWQSQTIQPQAAGQPAGHTPPPPQAMPGPIDLASVPTPWPAPTRELPVPAPTDDPVAAKTLPCEYPLDGAQSPTDSSRGVHYPPRFTTRRTVLTSTTRIELAQWLTTSQLLFDRPVEGYTSFEAIDTQTGVTRTLGIYPGDVGEPLWLEKSQSLIFAAQDRGALSKRIVIMRGNAILSNPVEAISLDLASVADGDGVLFVGAQERVSLLSLRADSGKTHSVIPDSVEQATVESDLTLPATDPGRALYPYKLAAYRQGQWVAAYNNRGAYLIDVKRGTICNLEPESRTGEDPWAWIMKWSLDGRYLAAVLVTGRLPARSYALAIRDMTTGVVKRFENGSNISAIEWQPDGHALLVIAYPPTPQGGPLFQATGDLLLVNAESDNIEAVQPSWKLYAPGSSLKWSPTGEQVALSSLAGSSHPATTQTWNLEILSTR